MPKSKNRSNHSQKVAHQRMLDKHSEVKKKKEFETKIRQIRQLQEQQKATKDAERLQHMKAIISGDIQQNSAILIDAQKGVIMNQE